MVSTLLRAALATLVAVAATSSIAQPPEHDAHADDDRTAARGRSRQEVLMQDGLHAVPGKQAHLLRIEYPAGWIGRRHYHTGDVFLYVLEGRFSVDVDGKERATIGPGEVYHEAVKVEMQARNASASEPTKILLFQIGNPGERLTVITD
jgi:quercetin dioxygenase-like cupin family protein